MRYSASKYSVTLKTGLRVIQGHRKRRHTTFYWSAIVIIVLYCTVFELFDVDWYCDLEIWVRGHSTSFKLVPFESLGAISNSPSIVTMALSCTICQIKPDIGRKSWFFHSPLAFGALVRGSPSEYRHPVLCGKTRMMALPDGEKTLKICINV